MLYTGITSNTRHRHRNNQVKIIGRNLIIEYIFVFIIVISIIGILISGVYYGTDANTGCYSFVCPDFDLNNYTITNYKNYESYYQNCDCNYCVDNYNCNCDSIQCYLYASDLTKDCQVLSDYSRGSAEQYQQTKTNTKGTIMDKNNLWSYYDIQNYKINSTYMFYDRSYEDYCYIPEQVEDQGYYVYAFLITLIICCGLLLVFSVLSCCYCACLEVETEITTLNVV